MLFIHVLFALCSLTWASPAPTKRPIESADFESHKIRYVNSGREDKRRIIAIGSIDGNLTKATQLFQAHKILDGQKNWIAQNVIVIQLVSNNSFQSINIVP
jgi:hypothetical protein